jgi:hypothetical protein
VKARIAHCLIAFSLIVAVGGHWTVLQSVAWFGMVVTYSQDAPLSVALGKTFDGNHPCKLCKVVDAGKKSEKQQVLLKVETKLDYWLTQRPQLLFPPDPFAVYCAGPDLVQFRAESPPTTPLRTA